MCSLLTLTCVLNVNLHFNFIELATFTYSASLPNESSFTCSSGSSSWSMLRCVTLRWYVSPTILHLLQAPVGGRERREGGYVVNVSASAGVDVDSEYAPMSVF